MGSVDLSSATAPLENKGRTCADGDGTPQQPGWHVPETRVGECGDDRTGQKQRSGQHAVVGLRPKLTKQATARADNSSVFSYGPSVGQVARRISAAP